MNITIIGNGHVSEFHKNAIRNTNTLKLYGVFDINSKNLSNIATGIKKYKSVQECLNDDLVDSVLLLIPSSVEKQSLSKCILQSGKNLLTDKPISRTLPELLELVALANRNRVFIHGIFHSRWSVTIKELVRLFDAGKYKYEEISEIKVWAYNPVIENNKIQFKPPEKSCFMDEGPNIIAEALYFLPDICILEANRRQIEGTCNDAYTSFLGRYENIQIYGEVNWINTYKEKGIQIVFRNGHKLKALHTDQKIFYDDSVIYDGVFLDPITLRLQKDYDNVYAMLDSMYKKIESNEELMVKVARIIDSVESKIWAA